MDELNKNNYFNNQNRNLDNNYNSNSYGTPYGNNFSYNNYTNSEDLKTSSFYSESYRKPRKKNKGIFFQMLIVALISSIIGGGIVAGYFEYLSPKMNDISSLKTNTPDLKTNNNNTSGMVKKIEIVEQSDSVVTAVAEKVGPSIVGINVKFQGMDFFGFSSEPQISQGSGIIISEDGYIMTNNHVIENAIDYNSNNISEGATIEIYLPNQIGKPYIAQVVGRDVKTDLAVIKIDEKNLPAAELGDSDELKVGQAAIAIGNPAGLEYMGTVTAGIISGLNRTMPITDEQYVKLIQTDAAINPGNSGGALLNTKGQVIGVNTAKITGSEYEGLGFAIPINTAKEIVNNLIEYKYVKGRPNIGVYLDPWLTEDVAKQNNLPMGVLVSQVIPLSPAYYAGIEKGDIITHFNDIKVDSYEELEQEKNKNKPGDTVKIKIYRYNPKTQGGEYFTYDLTLGETKGN